MMLDYLRSRLPFGFSPGLQNITTLCKTLGNPQKKFESIHVVGTNGKGSTAFYAANILQAHNIKTGLFTSPHLVSVRERFRINGKFISQEELEVLLGRIEGAAGAAKIEPSYFETLTVAAFLWFAEQGVEVAVLEAGLGGRLDSTKIAEGKIVALTSIGLDHTEILGDTEEKILQEKLGIMSEGAVLVRSPIEDTPLPPLQVGNYGKAYIQNAELAYATAKCYCEKINPKRPFNEGIARAALKNSTWHGRMQFLFNQNGELDFILDGAHNPQAARTLSDCLSEKNVPPLPCIFASLADKDTKSILAILKPHISICLCVPIDSPRARKPKEIAEICEELEIKTETCALSFTESPALITGSLYLVGATIKELASKYPELAEFRNLDQFSNEISILPL